MKNLLLRNLALLGAVIWLALQTSAQAQLSGRHEKLALSSETGPSGKKYGNIDGCILLNDGLTTFYHVPAIFFDEVRLYQGKVGKVDREVDGDISYYAVNNPGELVFIASFNGEDSLFLASPAGYKTIALIDDPAPGGGVFDSFPGGYAVNDASQVAFHAFTSGGPGQGIYFQTGSGIQRRALLGGLAPDGGHYTDFGQTVWTNDHAPAQTVFTATTDAPGGGGLFLATSESSSVLLTALRPSDFILNNAGQVAFSSYSAVHLVTTAGDVAIVSSGEAAPGGGTFSSFDAVTLNHNGTVAFRADVNNGPGGIFLWTPSTLKAVALNDSPSPGGGTFTSFGYPRLNNADQVVFTAGTSGGNMICFSDGEDFFKVVGVGESLLGVTITDVDLGSGRIPMNDLGQVAYFADFSNGVRGLFIFTPGKHWHSSGAGSWDTAASWTKSVLPASTDHAAIDPVLDATVAGPAANATVRSLLVGSGAGDVTLELQPAATLTTTAGMTLAGNATLAGAGTIGGNLTLLAGTHVALQLGGPLRGADYDFLKVNGRAVLTGTLDVTLTNGLVLHGRDTFDLFDLKSRSGNFVTLNLPTPPTGMTWDTSKLYTTGVITVSMATFFAANQGDYAGLVTANPAAFESTGSLKLKLDQDGGLSGTLRIGGDSIPVRGELDETGFFSSPLGTTGFTLAVQLDLNLGVDQITATITQNGAPFSTAKLDRAQTGFTKDNPVPLAGTYTVALPADPAHPEAAYPHGDGYGYLVVQPNGTVKLVGVLGDQTKASPAGILSKNNEFSVYYPLYGGDGFLSGVLTLHDAAAANHVVGTLRWSKPANSSKSYPGAFEGDIVVAGSHYIAPPTQAQILPAGPATFTISSGDITATPAKNLTVATGNAVTITTVEKFSLKFTAKTGLFGGAFLDADGESRKYKGAFLQKQNVGKGVFKGELLTGKIELQPQ